MSGLKYRKIIISGQRCTGKSTLLWELQKRLSLPIFSISMFLRDYIRTWRLDKKQMDERRVEVAREVDERILALVKGENACLIEAKVFHFVKNKFPETCNILLKASDKVRYERDAKREGISFAKAKVRVDKREGEWLQTMSEIYGFSDFFDEQYYDLVVDTTGKNREEVADEVEGWLRR